MSSPRRSTRLSLQPLEARETPATFGETWLDGRHLTLSFVPDGTPVLGAPSSLGSLLSSLSEPNAKFEIVRAFQAWASRTNLNVGLVADHGTPWDQVGGYQNDHRHGDIRIAARPLAGDVVAIAAPNGLWSASGGDIILNSQKTFTVNGAAINKYDLFTVVLQEAGHAFGLANSRDPGSAMYEQYDRALPGPTATDVANLQALYGVRQQDEFEGPVGNNSQFTAAPLTGPIEADLTSAAGTDWYRFTATAATTTVRLKASGLSLLTARIEVFDAAGVRLAAASTTDPLNNDLTAVVPGTTVGSTLFVKVSSARTDAFGVGAYRLTADALGDFPTTDPAALVDAEAGANDTPESAVTLTPVQDPVARPTSYLARSSLAAAGDVDYFRVRAPLAGGNKLVVNVSGVGIGSLAPTVRVFNAAGDPVPAKTLAVSANHVVLAVKDATPGADYLIAVSSPNGTVANYDLAAGFRVALPKANGSYGNLGQAAPTPSATLVVYQSQVMNVALANLSPTGDGSAVVTITGSDGRLVARLQVGAGRTDSLSVFLRRGSYRIEVTQLGGDPLAGLAYELDLFGLTDPEGVSPSDPGGTTGPPLPPPPPSGETVAIQDWIGIWF